MSIALFRNWSLRLAAFVAIVVSCLGVAKPAAAQQPYSQFNFRVQVNPQAGPALPAGPTGISANTLSTKLDKEIDDHFEENDLPGLVVLYARDGMLTYKRIKGKADVANNTPMSEYKVMRLNSVSKMVGSVVALKLAEQGKLNLNASARSYLPDLPEHHTYRLVDILACRSGVRHYGGTTSPDSPTNWGENDFATAAEAAPNFWLDPLANVVGEYHYSTHAYTIADAIAEKATGQAIKNVLSNTISTPYGVPSLKLEELDDNNPNRVKFYTVKNGQNTEITPPKKEWCPSGGGYEAKPIDLLKFGIKLGDGQILSQASLQNMMKRRNPLESYALGVTVAVENGYHVMTKSGSAEGSNAYIWVVPQRRMVMVVMANRDGADVSGLGNKLRSIILGADKAGGENADLVVEDFQRTAAPRYNGSYLEIPVRFKVVNKGIAGANELFVNSVWVSGKHRWTGFMHGIPGKGYSRTVNAVVKISDPNKFLKGRTLELRAWADAPIAAADTSVPSWGRVKESNNNNNVAILDAKVPGGLDLTGPKPPSTHSQPDPRPTRLPVARPLRQPTNGFPQRPAPQRPAPQRPTTRPAAIPGIKTYPAPVIKTSPAPQPTRRRAPQATFRPAFRTPSASSRKADLQIRDVQFDRSNPKLVRVVIGNAGQGMANASKLRLTLRTINGVPAGRTTYAAVPALAFGQSKVIVIDASSILPTPVLLKDTTFRLDADATNVVNESDEANNLRWHNL